MRALILAAGYGERMGKLTNHLPKPLIPVANKPLIQYVIGALFQSGIKDFIVAVGYLKDQLASFLYHLPGKKLSILVKEARDFEKGPIHTFSACMDEIQNNSFLLVPANLLIEPTLIADFLKDTEDAALAIAFQPSEITPQKATIHISKDNLNSQVLGINSNLTSEKSEERPLLPLLSCRTDLSPYIKQGIKSQKTKVIDALEFYLREGHKISAYKIGSQYWSEIDTIQDVLDANKYLLNQLHLSKHSELPSGINKFEKISIKAPILLGNNCQIENNCTLGPNVSIGDNSYIGANVTVQNAIICPSSNIPTDSKIENAIFFKSIYSIS